MPVAIYTQLMRFAGNPEISRPSILPSPQLIVTQLADRAHRLETAASYRASLLCLLCFLGCQNISSQESSLKYTALKIRQCSSRISCNTEASSIVYGVYFFLDADALKPLTA